MLRYLTLSLVLLTGLVLQGCDRTPSYSDTIRVEEGNAVWEVTLYNAVFHPPLVVVEVEYRNISGSAFTLHPRNVIIRDAEGNRYQSQGGNPYLPLVRPGESYRIKIGFDRIPTSGSAFSLYPFEDLAGDNPHFHLKDAGGIPLPGEHLAADWDQPR